MPAAAIVRPLETSRLRRAELLGAGACADKAMRLLDQLNAAPALEFLRTPPSNRLEKLRGDRTGYWSLRINDQWRIVFRWKDSDALDVEILDYHR